MNIPKNPTGLWINRGGRFTVINWNQVLKDIDNNYTIITSYNIYTGAGSDITKMTLLAVVANLDEAGIVKTAHFDFSNSNNFYAVQAVNSSGMSDAVSINSISGMIMQPMLIANGLIWNVGNWNQCVWNQ
jgi:hypothetical protein